VEERFLRVPVTGVYSKVYYHLQEPVQRLAERARDRSSSAGRVRISLLHAVQTGSGIHPISYPMGNGGSFPGGKATGA
jgi:hypothetical protein